MFQPLVGTCTCARALTTTLAATGHAVDHQRCTPKHYGAAAAQLDTKKTDHDIRGTQVTQKVSGGALPENNVAAAAHDKVQASSQAHSLRESQQPNKINRAEKQHMGGFDTGFRSAGQASTDRNAKRVLDRVQGKVEAALVG